MKKKLQEGESKVKKERQKAGEEERKKVGQIDRITKYIIKGQWSWLSWQSGCLQHQWSAV